MIKLLDKSVYELIAAGEVIERPSSVVKELVENAIDAGSKRICVEIKNGGITYMRVTDDGCGISYNDVPTAFLRHATSKLSSAGELENILTLGFRGEALASVAAVAKIDILTKRAEDKLGTAYKIEGGEETLYEYSGCPDGTTIIMRELFFNTPARLKFLKKDVTEGNYVQSVVDKLALSYPDIAFTFIRDNKTVRVTSGDGKLYSAVYSVFGKQFAGTLTEADYEHNHISVKGYISIPYACRSNRQMQYFFINGRWVRNTTCMAALEEGYRNSVMTGKFPACVLNIEMPPSDIDVNVSPSKTEVRFADEKKIFETVYLAVKNGILNGENNKEILLGKGHHEGDSSFDSSPDIKNMDAEEKKTDGAYSSVFEKKSEGHSDITDRNEITPYPENRTDERTAGVFNSSKAVYKPLPPKNIYVQELLDTGKKEAELHDYEFINSSSFVRAGTEDEKKIQIPDPIVEEKYKAELKFIGELFKTYILCECGEELIFIDKHAAHERIRFEQLKKEISGSSQILAESITVPLSIEEITALSDNADYLEGLGIDLFFRTDKEVEITGFPSMLMNRPIGNVVEQIAEILIDGGENIEGMLFDDIFHTSACKGAIRANETTSAKELEILAERIWKNREIRYCPHGRPIITTISKYNIERNFGRIQ